MKGKRFLIVHLEANGDCLMATTIARQIKSDYPDSQITWAISEKCKEVILHNPYIDDIWVISYTKEENVFDVWKELKKIVAQKIKDGLFDKVLYTQLHLGNLHHYDGTTRSSTFRAYPHKITVPIAPTLILNDCEVDRVKKFVENHQILSYRKVLLVECAPSSGQSLFNMEIALQVGTRLVKKYNDLIYIISTHIPFNSPHGRIIDGSSLTFRENAELSKYCTFLLGCSSGITWLLTSEWAKKIPTVQILNPKASFFQFASVKYDFQYWKLDHQHIIEITNSDVINVFEVVIAALADFKKASQLYNESLVPKISSLNYNIELHLRQKKISKAIQTFFYFLSRNNNKLETIYKACAHVFKILFSKIFA
jgi:hypothetical protein